MSVFSRIGFWRPALVVFLSLSCAAYANAQQGSSAPGGLVIGSPNTATADPPVPRPSTRPCVVHLFFNFEFADFSLKPFSYAPPMDCPAPWAKVVFVADFNVTAGIQFDRDAQVTIGNTEIYYGTTPEPNPNFGPSWHVERDVTDYSALLASPQSGDVNLGNLVNSTFTGIIFGSAELQFYPANFANPAPRVPDLVLSIPGSASGAGTLASTTSTISQTFTLPTNIERAFLDVFTQSQSSDEFWYTCVPNDVAAELFSCPGTAFREAEITIDGQPAGVAPVYPWIFTGGIDPFLWAPIPGVQTLNFIPYRVDLTPFAGVLSNGLPHTVALGVFNADNHFLGSGVLFFFLDHGSAQVTGEVTANTIGAGPSPVVNENISTTSGFPMGTVSVASSRQFTVAGFVETSHGRVDTRIVQNLNFSNAQQFNITASTFAQDITQLETISSATTTKDSAGTFVTQKLFTYPLTLDFSQALNADGSGSQTTTIRQQFLRNENDALNGIPVYVSVLTNTVAPADTLFFNSSFQITGNQGQKSSQRYFFSDSSGACYSRKLTAANNVLTGVVDGQGCKE